MAAIPPEKSAQLARRNLALYNAAMTSGGEDYHEQAFLNERYYSGQHWTVEEEAALGDRPALTMNKVFKMVNTIRGLYSGSTYSIRAEPREIDNDSQRTVSLNAAIDFVLDKIKYKRLENSAFDDGIIQNRGYIDLDIGFDDNFLGSITGESIDPLDILPEPGAKTYDPEGWAYYLKLGWATLSTIEQSYGAKARELVKNAMGAAQCDWGTDGRGAPRKKFAGPNDYRTYTEMYYDAGTEKDPDWRIRIIELNEKVLETRWVLVDPITGDTEKLPVGTTKAAAEMRANEEQYDLARKQIPTVRQVITAGDNVTLYEGVHSRPFYTLTPFFPFFRRGVTPGYIDQIISPNDMLNKTLSQGVHTVSATAQAGWLAEEGSMVNIDDEDLEEVGAQVGLNIIYKRGRPKPEKIQPNGVPSGLDHLTTIANEMIDNISGFHDIDVAQLNSEPAVRLALKQAALPFVAISESLTQTREIIGKKVIWYLQNYYKEPRRLKIKGTDKETGQQTEEILDINVSEDTDITQGYYDVQVESVPGYEADEDTSFSQLVVMKKEMGMAVPDNMIIKHSSVPEKDELAVAVAEASQPSPEEQALQQRQMQLELDQKQADLEKQRADTDDRRAGSMRMIVQTAQILSENPAMALIAEQLQQGAFTAGQSSEEAKEQKSQEQQAEAEAEQMRQQSLAAMQGRAQQTQAEAEQLRQQSLAAMQGPQPGVTPPEQEIPQ